MSFISRDGKITLSEYKESYIDDCKDIDIYYENSSKMELPLKILFKRFSFFFLFGCFLYCLVLFTLNKNSLFSFLWLCISEISVGSLLFIIHYLFFFYSKDVYVVTEEQICRFRNPIKDEPFVISNLYRHGHSSVSDEEIIYNDIRFSNVKEVKRNEKNL